MTLSAPHPHTSAPATDAELVARWMQGEEAAFDALFARHRGPVLGYASRMLQRREEAEEVCLETFARVVEGRYRPGGSFRSFVFTIAHRLCLDRLRRRGRWARVRTLFGGPAPLDPTPEAHALQDERCRRLDAALATLPEGHRSALLLYYKQELSSREVAEILGITDQQLRSQLSYARRRLRETLGPDDGRTP